MAEDRELVRARREQGITPGLYRTPAGHLRSVLEWEQPGVLLWGVVYSSSGDHCDHRLDCRNDCFREGVVDDEAEVHILGAYYFLRNGSRRSRCFRNPCVLMAYGMAVGG